MTSLSSAQDPAEPLQFSLERRVGKFDMRVVTCPHTPESQARWDRRVDTLTAWLLSQWDVAGDETEHMDSTINN